ncbi:hypothetical protein KPH14_010489 [Odynerus spinipes]|uniref:CBM21 domain-containing protein n=1 Tax=Odynerus spinipes TaxID=1348599 RepID=A0AAD9VT98_9HYME|nr:hypothetical protein KPH14_010489 [Odynerus spinipes]
MIVAPTMEENSGIFESSKLTGRMNGHSMTINTGNREPKELDSSSSSSSPSDSDGSSVTGSSSNRERRLSTDDKVESAILEMSSADSAGTEYGRGRGHGHADSSCGLVGSLFSSGCRGRAEAFARRLHRRLTSLGNANDPSQNLSVIGKPITREVASWLHAPSEALTASGNSIDRVFRRQPRHSSETELYYDFDAGLDLEHEPTSPAEEVTAAELADLLVNTEILKTNHHDACHCSPNGPRLGIDQDSESECVFVSPVNEASPESEPSEIYFDPDSSDVDKTKNEVYYDPVTTSESEATSNVCNNVEDVPAKAKLSLPADGQANRPRVHQEDSSDSSLSSSKNKPYERFRFEAPQGKVAKEECSSEDSLNDRSSRDTTSPSHESLWSTFDDDSTVSLKDETSRSSHEYLPPQKHLPKSHSDSEIPSNIGRVSATSTLPKTTERNEDEGCDVVDFVDPRVCTERSPDPVKEQDSSSCDCTDDKVFGNGTTEEVEPISDDSPTDANEQLDTDLEESVANGGDHSTYTSTFSIPDALTVECPTGRRLTEKLESSVKNEVTLRIENGTVLHVNDEEKMCLLLKELDRDREASLNTDNWDERANSKEPEEEEEEDRPQRIRRCSSLKTGKTPPGTPGRKKIVRFADVLGLDLADVRTFLDEIPKIPNSAYSDLIYDDNFQKESSPANVSVSSGWDNRYFDRRGSMAAAPRVIDKTLIPLFQQPGGLPTFLDLVRERKVCLENVLVQDPVTLCIQGTVRVLNLDFHKSVHIRYTLNSWKNFSDLQATYILNSCDGFSDKFSFILYCHTLTIGQRLEFAVRFQCKGSQYWDNNGGANYCFQCLPVSSNVEYVPTRAAENNRDWSPVFY